MKTRNEALLAEWSTSLRSMLWMLIDNKSMAGAASGASFGNLTLVNSTWIRFSMIKKITSIGAILFTKKILILIWVRNW